MADNKWNTGLPTEGGWYLLALDYEGERRYNANEWTDYGLGPQWRFAYLGEIVKWQKIEDKDING